MKKIFLAIAIVCFVAFGAIGIQNLMASSNSVEMVNFDKDPKKDGDKKSKDSKETTEVKAESTTTTATTTTKDGCCSSSCSSKSSSSCCSKEKEDCSKSCPDKK